VTVLPLAAALPPPNLEWVVIVLAATSPAAILEVVERKVPRLALQEEL
jgi:hypothetical protein